MAIYTKLLIYWQMLKIFHKVLTRKGKRVFTLCGKVKRYFVDDTTTSVGGLVDGHGIFEGYFSWVIGQKSGDFHGRLS